MVLDPFLQLNLVPDLVSPVQRPSVLWSLRVFLSLLKDRSHTTPRRANERCSLECGVTKLGLRVCCDVNEDGSICAFS